MISLAVGGGRGGVGVGSKVWSSAARLCGLGDMVFSLPGWMLFGRVALRDVLVVVQVLFWNVVFRHLARGYLRHVRFPGILYAFHDTGFERVSFFQQFLFTLGFCHR
jgi:hypothetical protein